MVKCFEYDVIAGELLAECFTAFVLKAHYRGCGFTFSRVRSDTLQDKSKNILLSSSDE
jgi:hypothetical protein